MLNLGTWKRADRGFVDEVDFELKRAERYRIFVALVVLDLSNVVRRHQAEAASVAENVLSLVRRHVREIDQVAVLGEHKLGLLLPETTRQGAEVAGRRLTELIRTDVFKQAERKMEEVIPVEMASYPDSSGAKTIREFLREISKTSMN